MFKFAGDALLVLWPPPPESFGNVEAQRESLPELVHRVVQCALEIQQQFGSVTLNVHDNITLRIKLGVGIGNACVMIVGGVFDRCEYLACGPALAQAFGSEVCTRDVCDEKKIFAIGTL